MLGVRRATVTVVAQAFQSAGLIQYARGVMTILDRERLKKAACECYDIVARQFERVASCLNGWLARRIAPVVRWRTATVTTIIYTLLSCSPPSYLAGKGGPYMAAVLIVDSSSDSV